MPEHGHHPCWAGLVDASWAAPEKLAGFCHQCWIVVASAFPSQQQQCTWGRCSDMAGGVLVPLSDDARGVGNFRVRCEVHRGLHPAKPVRHVMRAQLLARRRAASDEKTGGWRQPACTAALSSSDMRSAMPTWNLCPLSTPAESGL